MSRHLLAYRQARGVPIRIRIRGLPPFGHGVDDARYRLIDDDEVAEELRDYGRNGTAYFRYLSPDELEDILGSAEEAVAAVKAGEYDDVLDMLIYAERNEFGNRVTVVEAIADRHEQLVTEAELQANDDDTDRIAPADVAPGTVGD